MGVPPRGWLDDWQRALRQLAPRTDEGLVRAAAALLAHGDARNMLLFCGDLRSDWPDSLTVGPADFWDLAAEAHAIRGLLISEAGRLIFGPPCGVEADIYLHRTFRGLTPRPLNAGHPEFVRYLANPAGCGIWLKAEPPHGSGDL
jgi:hypothetical protein